MSDSIRDLAATIAGLKDQAGRLRAAVVADKGTADGLVERFRAVGVEGGPVARLSGCAAGHERAVSQLEAIESRLERARFIAMSAISGLHGSGTVARSGDQADDPTSWEIPTSGTELAEPSGQAKRGKLSGLARASMSENAMDGAKSLTESMARVSEAFRREFGPPMQGTQSETQIPSGPKVQVAKQPVGPGDAAMAVIALGVVVAKGSQTLTSAINRWSGRKRESDT